MGHGQKSHYKKISEYGAIGNLRSLALVGKDGSIDWCCFPHLDRPSVFASILDQHRGGSFRICPADHARGEQRYLEHTNILETIFTTSNGALTVTDFFPLAGNIDGKGNSTAPCELIRLLRAEGGSIEVEINWSPRFDYARSPVRIEKTHSGFLSIGNQGERLALGGLPANARVVSDDYGPSVHTVITLAPGEEKVICTRWDADTAHLSTEAGRSLLVETAATWKKWVEKDEATGDRAWADRWSKQVIRSELALKLLIHADTGAIAAAPTTSLPESIGGERNWDYRYAWIRDSSLTAQALNSLGHSSEVSDFLIWAELVSRRGCDTDWLPHIMYGLHGETDLTEQELSHLEGYRQSQPVRIGNGASDQIQLDVYGELMNSAYHLWKMRRPLNPSLWNFLAHLADRACSVWQEPDYGIWEVRTEPRHFVYSKLMVWVALDKAVLLARHYNLPGNVTQWEKSRDSLRDLILTEGYNPEIGSFVQSFGSHELDAANLLIPLVEFLPFDDPRIQGTINRTLERLTHNGMVYRYLSEDGLSGHEGTFGICTFWMVDVLALSKRMDEAMEIFENMVGKANHVYLYPEQLDADTGEFLGNFPQAFTHIGFINSALYLSLMEGRSVPIPDLWGSDRHRKKCGHI